MNIHVFCNKQASPFLSSYVACRLQASKVNLKARGAIKITIDDYDESTKNLSWTVQVAANQVVASEKVQHASSKHAIDSTFDKIVRSVGNSIV